MNFYSPWVLLLFLPLPLVAYFMVRKKGTAAIRFSSLAVLKGSLVSWRLRFRPVMVVLRLVCVALLIIAIARPRKGTQLSEISTEAVAIEVVVDRSGSMGTEMSYGGVVLNRLEVAKNVLADFIAGDEKKLKGRAGDLIGLITFARYADTKCPLVHSHNALLEFLKKTELVTIRSEDGTAIGDSLALAAARLKNCEQDIERWSEDIPRGKSAKADGERGFKIKSKVIILLTDGRNNVGKIEPLEAAELAGEWGIKIYTIGIGSGMKYRRMGGFRVPVGQELDEGLLQKIAEKTGGFYSRAGDAESLRKIMGRIDKLEKTKVKSVQYTQFAERFGPWAFGALLFLAFEILLGCTVFRKIP